MIRNDWPRLEAIQTYYQQSLEALRSLQHRSLSTFESTSRFWGMTVAEFEKSLRTMRRELDAEVSLALLASVEATFRSDFLARVSGKQKAPHALRRSLRSLKDDFGSRVRLEDIIKCWKSEVGTNPDRFNTLIDYLDLRDWLAHGRYWSRAGTRLAEPDLIYSEVQTLFSLLRPMHFPTGT